MRNYMFDTVVFNRILDGAIQLSALTDRIEVHATHVQRDEIEQTTDPNRRTALMQIFHDVVRASQSTASFVLGASRLGEARLGGERVVPTPSAVYGVSEYGHANYTQNDNLYLPIRLHLDELNAKKPN